LENTFSLLQYFTLFALVFTLSYKLLQILGVQKGLEKDVLLIALREV